ncbi:hypothetical protein ABT160_36455 [Streptomyces sp. NPDC001941]|uniref:hypothetical protein n=1 Tax=Streptomyces sp. NPDC001941 TaxID=3154659 RepID=UPI00331C666F
MLDTPEAVFEALRENHDRPHGTQRTVTAEELVDAAEAFDKPDVLVTALHELMSAYEFTGEHRKSPVAFARVLKLWDASRDAFSDWEAHQVFWRFKWVTTSLLQVPEVPLAAVQGWIGQMRTRYQEAGHGMQPVAAMRYHVAVHTGAGIPDAYDLWATRPRTGLSDCEACETRHFAAHQVAAGDDAAALDTWRPVFDGDSSCAEEPQSSQARALLPLLRLGRLDEARSHHLTGYRRVRGKTGMKHEVGLHLEFCAHSRNEGRGLEILAENRPLFEGDGAPYDHLSFLTGVEVLLARLVADGHQDTAVAGPPGRTWTAAALLATVRADAERLAAAFDRRNGTTRVGDARRERLAARPLLDTALPLGLRTPAARPATPDAPVPAPAPTSRVIPDDFAELVAEARRLSAQGHPGDDALWARVAERADAEGYLHDDAVGPEDRLRAELAEQRAYALVVQEKAAESRAELDRAVELFERADMPWQALAARARGWGWLARQAAAHDTAEHAGPGGALPDDDAVRAGLDAALADARRLIADGVRAEAPGDPEPSECLPVRDFGPGPAAADEYLAVLYFRAFAGYEQACAELPEVSAEAHERFAAADAELRAEGARLGRPHQVGGARLLLADLAARGGDLDTAEAELRLALAEIEDSARPWRNTRTRGRLAQVLLAKEQPEEAVELLHRALADAVRHDDTDFPMAPSYMMLGHAALHSGDATGAVRHLSEAAARYDRDGDPEQAAEVRVQLADVLSGTGRHADAVAVLESVLSDEAASALDERVRAQARLDLARGLRGLEEYREAAEEFLRLADEVAGWEGPERAVHTLVASEAATALALAGRWDAAAVAYDRALASHAEAPNPMVVVNMTAEFARLVTAERGAEGLEAALGHLADADRVRAGVAPDDEDFPVWYARGSVHYRRARVLAEAERFEESLAEAERAVAAHEEGGPDGEEPRAEALRIAALVEGNGLGRTAAAVARLTAGAERCDHAGLPDAARILRTLREDLAAQRQG